MEAKDLELEVLQEDIDKAMGFKDHPDFTVATSCPTAQAFLRMGFTNVVVGPGGTYAWRNSQCETYENSPALIEQIDAWDFHGTFSPIKTVLRKRT